jgi:hypothetical protein
MVRFDGMTDFQPAPIATLLGKVREQLEHELRLIAQLDYAPIS